MDISAQDHQEKSILITGVDSFLGASLAQFLLSKNYQVWAVGNPPFFKDLLTDHNFTLLELDLSQPIPDYLPSFDFVFYLELLDTNFQKEFSYMASLSPLTTNIISLAREGKSKIVIFAPVSKGEEFYEYLARGQELKEFLRLFLIGDIYGPGMPLEAFKKMGTVNVLGDFIYQAVNSDKVVLEKEGLGMVYAAYITDVLLAINQFVFSKEPLKGKNVQIIISEGPKTALTVAYEMQNVARLVLGRELALYFAGPQPILKPESESVITIHDLGFSPEVDLSKGLRNTFEYFLKEPAGKIEGGQGLSFKKETVRIAIDKTGGLTSSHLKNVSGRLTSKIGHLHLKPRVKNVLVMILAVLILVVGKLTLDVYLGVVNLKGAQTALLNGDLKQAEVKANNSTGGFSRAAKETRVLLYPFSLVFPQKVKNIEQTLLGMSIGASSVDFFVKGSQRLLADLAIITAEKPQEKGLDLETPAADFRKARFLASQAEEVLRQTLEGGVFKTKVTTTKDAFSQIDRISQSALELTSTISDLVGGGGSKTYLVLLQNNSELRPGGGFIGNFGLIEFDGGHLKNVTVEDIYTIDGQLQEKIEPPGQLAQALGIDRFYLRDSNWSGDFEVNSTTIRDFYKKETGKDVDGVIAVNLNLIQNILAKMGPVKLSDYDEEITSESLFERGEYYSEVGSFPGSTQKRDFFGALTRTLTAKILDSLRASSQSSSSASKSKKNPNSIPWLALLEVVRDGLLQKDLMLTFDDPNLSSFVRTRGWNWPLPPVNFNPADDSFETRDFLALVEANLGANKVNRFLERKITYEMNIGRDADLVAKLTITYTNNSQADTWPAGKYVNYLRLYVPFAASLFEFKNGDINDPKDVEVITQGNLTVFATMVEVPIKSSREVAFTYRIPKNIKLEKIPYYHLYVQKQSGTEKDPLEFAFNLPSYLEVKSVNGSDDQEGKQNLRINTDLSTDRQFEIEVVKK